jgi:hypothetical protein
MRGICKGYVKFQSDAVCLGMRYGHVYSGCVYLHLAYAVFALRTTTLGGACN